MLLALKLNRKSWEYLQILQLLSGVVSADRAAVMRHVTTVFRCVNAVLQQLAAVLQQFIGVLENVTAVYEKLLTSLDP